MLLITVLVSAAVSVSVSLIYIYLWKRRFLMELDKGQVVNKLKREVGEMVTELNGTAERNIQLIENEITKLKETIDQAVKTAGILKNEKLKERRTGNVYTSLSRMKPLHINIEEEISYGTETVIEEPEEKAGIYIPEKDFSSLSIREKALVLHRMGRDPESIASELNMSRGEIDLIISLHEGRSK